MSYTLCRNTCKRFITGLEAHINPSMIPLYRKNYISNYTPNFVEYNIGTKISVRYMSIDVKAQSHHICSSCGSSLKGYGILCGRCDHILSWQQAEDMSPFEMFALEPKFDIDMKALQSSYRRLQKQVHPDKCARAEDLSAMLTQSMKTLRVPDQRALAILKSYGVDIDDKAAEIGDNEYMMWIMELHEELDSIQTKPKSEQKILFDNFHKRLNAEIKDVESKICYELSKLKTPNILANDNRLVGHNTIQWVGKRRLLYRVENALNELEESLLES